MKPSIKTIDLLPTLVRNGDGSGVAKKLIV
jgi:hypothetical protein